MNKYPKYIDLTPTTNISGDVTLPGSKSISNRSLLLAALAKGTTLVYGLLASDDTDVMLNALQTLGVKITRQNDSYNYLVEGVNGDFPIKRADLFMGNAGTAIRPLTAALATMNGNYKLHGVARMHERPIGDLVDALNNVGAEIEYLENKGYPPILIKSGNIDAKKINVRGDVSSQFLTALLMASPLLSKKHEIKIEVIGELISKPYIEITLNIMEQFGVKVIRDEWRTFTIPKNSEYLSPDTLHVEGDASSASYFLAMGAITGTPICVHGVGKKSIQGDVRFIDALQEMGAEITVGDNWIQSSSDKPLKAIDADFNHIPDAAMTLSVVALYAQGSTILRNIGSWRVKETDRISAMATELRKLGAEIEEGEDWLRITPPKEIKDAAIDTYDDHRMAMCFSLASLNGKLRKGAKIRINNPECVAKTFPKYFQVFENLTKK